MADRRGRPRRAVRDWRLAAEAACWLALAGLAVRRVSFARLVRFAAGSRLRLDSAEGPAAAEIGRAVEAAARRAPWLVLCFEKGLAAHAMLRLRGRPSVLFYGGRIDASRRLTAHVWVKSGRFSVVGGDEAARFGVLAAFPPLGSSAWGGWT